MYTYVYRHHSDNRSMPIYQQGLGWPKVGGKKIDQQGQQGAQCRGNRPQSSNAKLKAQLQRHTDFPAC